MTQIEETIAKFSEYYDMRHVLARRWKSEGKFKKVIGYTYAFMPEELIFAAGALPVQLTESEEKSSLGTGNIYVPEFFCDFCQSIVGQAVDGMYNYLDGVIFSISCVPLKLAADIWDMETDIPYFNVIDQPCVANEPGNRYVMVQFQRIKKDMEKLCGTMITDESLKKAIDVYNENRRLMHELYELRRQAVPLISGSDCFEVVKAALVMPKDMHNELLKELISQLKEKMPEGKPKPRIMVSAFIFEEVAIARPNFIRLAERAGLDVVFDDLCFSPRYFWEEVKADGDRDPMEAMVDCYAGKVPIAFKVSPQYRAAFYVDAAQKYNVKGAIFFTPMYCESFLFHQPYIEEKLKEKGISSLIIETQAGMEEAALSTRIEAFAETLQ